MKKERKEKGGTERWEREGERERGSWFYFIYLRPVSEYIYNFIHSFLPNITALISSNH